MTEPLDAGMEYVKQTIKELNAAGKVPATESSGTATVGTTTVAGAGVAVPPSPAAPTPETDALYFPFGPMFPVCHIMDFADPMIAVEHARKLERQRDELRHRLKSAEFWDGVYPDGWNAERIANEMHDFSVVMDGLPALYDYITGGKASKPNTDKSVIRALYDDHLSELIDEAVKDAMQAAGKP